ncbi:GntR family transcriptional regulator [Peribacillus sp. B-H-3]|uniref:GntR family transcriptional regulator n=1 Tax=Peribacillus sp. B-H-3 TaxID=3400420 RepID=UPI003B012017
MKPIQQQTTQDIVYKQVLDAILNGAITRDEVFTEVQLAETLNTSRTPVRGALQTLVKEGLLVSIPRKGLTVRKISQEEQDEIFLLRSSIELEVMKKLTTTKVSKEGLMLLKHLILQQEEAMNNDDNIHFIDLDQEFHLTLTRLSNYKLMEQVLINLHNLTQLMGLKAVSRKGRMKEVLGEHRQIIHSIEEKNSESASKFILDHLSNSKSALNFEDR